MYKIREACDFIRSQVNNEVSLGLILGSGLGILAEQIENKISIAYEDIPYFPKSTVEGHQGKLVIGQLKGKHVIAMQGRFHYYEGYTMEQVTFPVRVMKMLGIHSIIVTNAAGGINESFRPGDLMLISDHINFTGINPLIGPNHDTFGDRFPDMTQAYDRTYIEHAKHCAQQLNIAVQRGVYVGNAGPTYETPAEIRMLRVLGGDAVGMSTVPEVIVARQAKIRVLGISCISNMAAGIYDEPLSHEEVIETTQQVQQDFIRFMLHIIETLPED